MSRFSLGDLLQRQAGLVGLVLTILVSGIPIKLFSQEFHAAQRYQYIISDQGSGPYARSVSISYHGDSLYSNSKYGPLRSTNSGRYWSTLMSPDDAVYFNAKVGLAVVWGATILYSGDDLQSIGRTFISTDGGEYWEQTWHAMISANNVATLTRSRYARVGDRYTSDGGLTWLSIPSPDSLPIGSQDGCGYLGDGTFHWRNTYTKRWYSVNVDSQRYESSNIPYKVLQVFLLSNGDVLGYEHHGATSRFHVRHLGNDEFEELPLISPEGQRIDSFYVHRIESLDGNAVAALCRESYFSLPDRFVVFVGDSTKTFRLSEFDTSAVRWGPVLCSSGNRFLAHARNERGEDIGMALINASTNSMHFVHPRGAGDDVRFSRFDPDCMRDSIATAMNKDGSVHLLNLNTGEITVGGGVEDPFGRFMAMKYDALVNGTSNLLSVDIRGTVSELREDSVSVLKGWQSGMDLTIHDADEGRNFALARTMIVGTGHVWARDNKILSGGPHLWELRDTAAHAALRLDTTTFWTRLNTGTDLAGYREVTRRLKGADQFDTVSTISDGRAVIGAMLQVSPDTLLAALRGYVHTIFEGGTSSEPDTIPGGLWRSTDGGLLWERIAMPFEGGMILCLQQRPSDSSVWISMRPVHRESIVETDANGKQTIVQELLTMGEISLLRSTDMGTSWTVVHSQSYNGAYQPSTSNVAFQGANTIAWATHDRVHWSDDNGSTWRLVDGIPGLTTIVGSVAFDTTGALWAATSEGLFKADPINVSVEEAESDNDNVNEPRGHSTPIFWANTYPNPTDRTFTLRLHNLDRLKGTVDQLEIVDLLGRKVLDLRPHTYGARPTGTVDIPLDLGTDTAGLYLLVGRTSDRAFTWPMWVY